MNKNIIVDNELTENNDNNNMADLVDVEELNCEILDNITNKLVKNNNDCFLY